MNPVGLGNEAEEGPVAVKAPGSSLDDLDGRLAVAIEQLVAQPSGGVLVGQLDDGRTVPANINDGNSVDGVERP